MGTHADAAAEDAGVDDDVDAVASDDAADTFASLNEGSGLA